MCAVNAKVQSDLNLTVLDLPINLSLTMSWGDQIAICIKNESQFNNKYQFYKGFHVSQTYY